MAKRKPRSAEDIAKWGEEQSPTTPDKSDLVLPFSTPDLTSKQRKMLAVDWLPEYISLTQERKADIAGVDPRSLRRFYVSEKYAKYAGQLARRLYGQHALHITHAQIKKAQFGGQDGLGDAGVQNKILQQIGVMDKDESSVNVNVTSMTDEQLRSLMAHAISGD